MSRAPEAVHTRTCPLCEAMCGLRIQLEGGRVSRIRGNPDDVWSRGYLCPKGTTLGELHHDPDRLRAPLVRDGDGFREVGWAEALREVARRLRPLIAEHGLGAVTAYIGNPTAHRLDAIRARGGRVVVVDPRRTGTADHADEWLPIRPGTDAALLLGMAHVLFVEGRVRLAHLEERVNGLADVGRIAGEFPPERVAGACGVPAETVRRLAREFSDAARAAVYGRIGTCNQEFGTLASWLVDVLNVLTGNLDREGGAMFSNPVAWSLASLTPPEFANGFRLGRWRSRVRGAPEVLGQVPISCLAEEIATPGRGQQPRQLAERDHASCRASRRSSSRTTTS